MSETTPSPYLTVAEAAAVLGISTDGIYKLIQRGKLPALRLSERGIRITRWALDAYRRSLNGGGPDTTLPEATFDIDRLREGFEAETGMSPDDWIAAWKRDRIEDSAENATRLVRALALRGGAGRKSAAAVSEDWVTAALMRHPAL